MFIMTSMALPRQRIRITSVSAVLNAFNQPLFVSGIVVILITPVGRFVIPIRGTTEARISGS